MSAEVNPDTGKYFTLKEMGEEFKFTKERVRQIIGNQGYRNSVFSIKNQPKECPGCQKMFTSERVYCSVACKWKVGDNALGIGVPRLRMSVEQQRAYRKVLYRKNPERIQAKNKKWWLKHKDTPEFKAKKKVYHQGYYQKNRERLSEYSMKLYWANPEKFRKKARDHYNKKRSLIKLKKNI